MTKGASGYVASPPTAAVEQPRLDDVVRLSSKLEVQRFVSDQEKPEHGLAAPFRRLRLEYGSADKLRVHTLSLGSDDGPRGRFAKLDDSAHVFVIARALADKLAEPLRAPRDARDPKAQR